MGIPHLVFIAACLSISIPPPVSAFYPYTPEYPSSGGGGDGSPSPRVRDAAVERSYTQSRAASSNGASGPVITLPLRRVPKPRPHPVSNAFWQRENKYKIVNSSTPGQKNSVAIDQDGTDMSYMVSVTIGSSKEEYHLLLDSAASNTWVMGEDCKSAACGLHNTFGAGDSTTLKKGDAAFSITYGTGSVSGTIATDTLHIASLSPTLTFGLATNVSQEFSSYPMDGILGIGRGDSVPGTIESPQLMDVLSTSKLIPAKLFAIHLSRSDDGLADGELSFGAVNPSRFDGDLNYIQTISNTNGFWEIPVDDAGVNGKTVGMKGRSAILDSGTSFILMPADDAVAVHKLIPGYTQSGETFTVPCKATEVIQLVFGGKTYNVSTADYIGGALGNGNCKSNIIGRQTFDPNQWLVGDVFLKNVYSVFDFDSGKVGLGVKGAGKASSASASLSASPPTPTSTGENSSPSATLTANASTPTVSNPASANPGASSTASSSPVSGNKANPTAESQQTGASPSAKGDAGRVSATSSSCFALFVALGLLAYW